MSKKSYEALAIVENESSTSVDLARAIDLSRGDDDVCLMALKHPSVSRMLISEIYKMCGTKACVREVAKHPLADAGSLVKIAFGSFAEDEKIMSEVARNINCPDGLLLHLIETAPSSINEAILLNPRLSSDGLTAIEGFVELQLLKSMQVSASQLDQLAGHDFSVIRLAVAKTGKAQLPALKKLMFGGNKDFPGYRDLITAYVCAHENLSDDFVVSIVSDDPNSSVLLNPFLSPGILTRYVKNGGSEPEKIKAALNKSCPMDVREAYVRESLKLLKAAIIQVRGGAEASSLSDEFVFMRLAAMAGCSYVEDVWLVKIRDIFNDPVFNKSDLVSIKKEVMDALMANPSCPKGLNAIGASFRSLIKF